MIAIAIDDDQLSLEYMQLQIESQDDIEELHCFSDADELLEWLGHNTCDVAFCDIIMHPMNGVALAQKIMEIQPNCSIVFVSGSKEFALDAIQIHASGYLVKPVTFSEVKRELDYIKTKKQTVIPAKTVNVQCFGSFEVFVDGKPLNLRYHKSKELLAYLIDRRGAICTIEDVANAVFPDRELTKSLKSQIRNSVADLTKSLEEAGADKVLIKKRGGVGVAVGSFDCDYYSAIAGDSSAARMYAGEYMRQYNWAENTNTHLTQILKRTELQ